MIEYKRTKDFEVEQIKNLFRSVEWFSDNFPERLPEYQGRGIASTLLKYILDDYTDFLYVDVVPDEKRDVAFYEKYGFQVMPEGTPLQIRGNSWKK